MRISNRNVAVILNMGKVSWLAHTKWNHFYLRPFYEKPRFGAGTHVGGVNVP